MASTNIKDRPSAKGTISYQVQVRGKGVEKPYSKSFPSMEAAEQWAAEQEQILNGASTHNLEGNTPAISSESAYSAGNASGISTQQHETTSRFSIANIVDEYLRDTQWKGGVKKKGYATVVQRMSTLSQQLDNKGIDTLTKQDIQQYTTKRRGDHALRSRRPIASATIRKELEILRRVLRWAVEEKGIKAQVEIKGDLLPENGKGRDRVLTEEEYKKLCAWCRVRMPWMEPMIILGWETAMRRGEILSLVPGWIDFDNRKINLPAEVCKNGDDRKVPLSTPAMELLKRLIGTGENRMKDDQLFFTMSYNTIPQRFKRACEACGIDGAVFHSLRHCACSRYGKLPGMNVILLSRITGHKYLKMLSRYFHTESSFIAGLMDQ